MKDEGEDEAEETEVARSDVDFSVVANQSLDPAIESWGVDIELSWNKVVEQDDGKIKYENAMDYASTTDLLCSPGKYIDDDYKLDKIYSSFGNTWSGNSDLPKEFVGMTLNGSFLAQTLQTDGGDLDSIYPTSGDM